MIQIYQDSLDMKHLANMVNKHSEVEIGIAEDFLNHNINSLKTSIAASKSKNDKAEMLNVLEFLEKIKAKTVDGHINLLWVVDRDGVVKSYPIDLVAYNKYKIRPTDYFKNDEGMKLMKADYTNVLELIAFDMMYRDLGYTKEEIERQLSDVGITSISSCARVLSIMNGESALECSTFMKIEDSPYATVDAKICSDYFNLQMFDSGRYKDCVDFSCRYALTAMLYNILQKVAEETQNYKICSINTSGIYIMIPEESANIVKDKLETAVVRVFGRKFEVVPYVSLL